MEQAWVISLENNQVIFSLSKRGFGGWSGFFGREWEGHKHMEQGEVGTVSMREEGAILSP